MLVEGLIVLAGNNAAVQAAILDQAAIAAGSTTRSDKTNGIFPGIIPEQTPAPIIAFGYAHEENQMTMDGPDALTICELQFGVQGTGYAQVKHLARALRECFEEFTGALTDGSQVDSIHRISETDTFQEGPFFHLTVVEFRAWYRDLGS